MEPVLPQPEASCGYAPEVLQARVREQMAAEAAENPQPAPVPETEFWVPVYGQSVKYKASEIQAYIYEKKLYELKVCPMGSTEWVDAKDQGFKYPEKTEEEKAQEVLPLGSPSTPQEEKLETYPDEDLVQMAALNNVQVPMDENNNLLRQDLIKLLVPFVK